MNPAPEISVVVPTHDRRDSVLRLLAGLRDGTFPADRFEVVVVADGCNDDTVAAVSSAAWPFSLRVIEQTPARGAATARNIGARASRSSLLVFIDDDIGPLPTLLAAHVDAHARSTDAARTSRGEPLIVVGAPIPARTNHIGMHHLALWGWWEQRFERIREPGHRFTYDEIFTGILSMPTSVFQAIGGFAESLPFSCRDDSEIGLRLIRHGVRIEFSREAGGLHHEIRDRSRLAQRKMAEGSADAMLARMHPETWPAVKLSWPDEPLWSRLGFFRRIAFAAPALGDLIAWTMVRALDALERIRARGYWWQLHAGTMYYWYWRGAATALGDASALRRLAEDSVAALSRRSIRELEIDLRDGVDEAQATLDRERPDAARLTYGACEIGHVPAVPGAEPLRGAHLRALLATADYARPLVAALGLEALGVCAIAEGEARPRRRSSRPSAMASDQKPTAAQTTGSPAAAADGAVGAVGANSFAASRGVFLPCPVRVGAVDLDRPITPIAGCGQFRALRLLVRLQRQPLGWLTVLEPGDEVSTERIQSLLVQQLAAALDAVWLRRFLSPHLPLPTPHRPSISVVVCTRDRTASLARCLDSLAALDYPHFEVIVVDNAPTTAATSELVATLAPTRPVRYVREDRPGLDWARNRGIREARHPIVAYTDDDVRVDADWLSGVAEAFADPRTMLVTGLVAPAELDTRAQLLFEYGYGGMGKGLTARSLQRDTLTDRDLTAAHYLGAGANMAFRRSVFERIGTFDTALDVGTPSHGAGDLDMFHRVLVSGATARYEPRALVWHSHRRDMPALARQLNDNGRAFGVYLLTCASRRDVPRGVLLGFAVQVWLGWMASRFVRRVLGRDVLPLPLQLSEMRGVLRAPFAWIATRRSDRRLRKRFGDAEDQGREERRTGAYRELAGGGKAVESGR